MDELDRLERKWRKAKRKGKTKVKVDLDTLLILIAKARMADMTPPYPSTVPPYLQPPYEITAGKTLTVPDSEWSTWHESPAGYKTEYVPFPYRAWHDVVGCSTYPKEG